MKRTVFIFVFIIVLLTGFSTAEANDRRNILYTDIRAFINGLEIPIYNIDGYIAVMTHNLDNYRFTTTWDKEKQEIYIEPDENKYVYPMEITGTDKNLCGVKYKDALPSNMKTFVCGTEVPSFSIDGYTAIYFQSLNEAGTVIWDRENRIAHFVSGDNVNCFESRKLKDNIVIIKNYDFEYKLRNILGKYTGYLTKEELNSIEDFYIVNYDGMGDTEAYSELELLENLKSITIGSSKMWIWDISDISNIAKCKSIEAVNINQCMVSDLSCLSQLENLKRLHLHDIPVNFDSIGDLNGLEELTISFFLTDYIPIDMDKIRGFVNLRRLTMGIDHVDMSKLNGSVNLEELNINKGNVENISSIDNMPRLEKLTLQGCILPEEKWPKIDSLKELNIGDINFNDLSCFSNLTDILKLNISYSQIKNIDDIPNMSRLEEVSLKFTDITDIEPLTKLKNLLKLELSNNPIEDYSPLETLEGTEIKTE